MTNGVRLDFVVGAQRKQMFEGLVEAGKVIVNFKATPCLWQILQFSKEWKILPRILIKFSENSVDKGNCNKSHHLGLLSDQKGKLQVVQAESVGVQTIRISQEAHMLNGILGLLWVLRCFR